jgi:hypothetical protein
MRHSAYQFRCNNLHRKVSRLVPRYQETFTCWCAICHLSIVTSKL